MSRQLVINFVPYGTQRPEKENMPVQITNSPYSSNPVWHIPQTKLTIAKNISTGVGFNFVDIAALNAWHRTNASSIFSTFIPSSYFYTFDDTTPFSTNIVDGGFDMFDAGNFISLSTTRTTTNIFTRNSNLYGLTSTLSNQNFGFMITAKNVWPQVSLAFLQDGSVLWRASGGIGSDNLGPNSNISSTYTTARGYTGRWWANEGWSQGFDPNICYVWFTIESTSWNTLISSSNNGLATGAIAPDPMNQFMRVTGCNYMFGMFLLSARRPGASGTSFFISSIHITNFLSNYVENANIQVT